MDNKTQAFKTGLASALLLQLLVLVFIVLSRWSMASAVDWLGAAVVVLVFSVFRSFVIWMCWHE